MKKWISLALALVLMCTLTLASAATLKRGSKGAQVTALQEKLKELKYFSGAVDGVYRKDLYEAVWRYQKDVGLQNDGIAGAKTLSRLGLAAAPKASTVAAKGLTVGAKGNTVTAIQNALRQKGYYSGSANGVYDDALWKAVWRYQRDKGMSATGVADNQLLQSLGLLSAAPATSAPIKGLNVGASGSTVAAVQSSLRQQGYYAGSPNGVYDDALWTAVWRYQRDKGMSATGVVDSALLKALGISAVSTPTVGASLRYGDQGDAVRALQNALKSLGYYTMRVDGIFGDGTLAAVQGFQRNNRLTVDGVAGPQTLSRLGLASAQPAPAGTTVASLKHGNKGAGVTALQNALKGLGYFTSTVDGVYGDSTFTAVWWFQTNNKLPATGAADSATINLLYSGKAAAK